MNNLPFISSLAVRFRTRIRHTLPCLLTAGSTSPYPGILTGCLLICALAGCTQTAPGLSPVMYDPSPRQATRSISTIAADTLILSRVKATLFSDDLLNTRDLHVIVRHGVVYLSGQVRTHEDRNMAGHLVRGVDGVVRVENQVRVSH